MSSDRRVRVSNDDRAVYDEALRQAYTEGRITDAELEERLAAVFNARYRAELEEVVTDLPDIVEPPVAVDEPSPWSRLRLDGIDGALFLAPIICTAIYAMTDLGGYFWPMWVWFGCMIPVLYSLLDRD